MIAHAKRTLIARGYWKDRDEEEAGGGGGEGEDNGEVVGQGNPHDDARARLIQGYDKSTEDSGEFQGVGDEEAESGHAEGAEEEASEATEEVAAEVPRKIKIKVDGQEEELTEEEVIALAQKGKSADKRFQEAAELRRQAEELRQPPEKSDVDENLEEDEVALARAIQMGSEAEAVEAIRKIRNRPSPGDDANLIDDRIRGVQAMERFKTEYADIVSDPDLMNLAFMKDQQLVAKKDGRGYWERFDAIGKELRGKYLKPAAAPSEDKVERKADVVTLKRAAARQAPAAEPDQEESPSAVIADIAKRRGQSVN